MAVAQPAMIGVARGGTVSVRLALLTSLLGLSACQTDHRQAAITQYPRGFRVNCPDWHKTEDGNWVSNENGTFTYPKNLGMVGDTLVTPIMPPHSNVNLWKFLELSCGSPPAGN